MSAFWDTLWDPQITFLRYAVLIGLLAGVGFGMMGTYVVTRRISYVAGAIAHSVLGGIGVAVLLQARMGWQWCHPVAGAIVAALLSAWVIGLVTMRARQREDTVIMALWVVGMAVGIVCLHLTPGYVGTLSYLFGNILVVSRADLVVVVLLDAVVVGCAALFYNRFLSVCFDEEFAHLRGIRVEVYYMLLLMLVALSTVLLVRVVGIVMVIALLTLPAAMAGMFARRLWQMMLLAICFCIVFTLAGVFLSYQWDLPTGPVIVLVAGVAYLASALVHGARR